MRPLKLVMSAFGMRAVAGGALGAVIMAMQKGIAYYVVGMIIAAVVGYVCIKTMLIVVRRKKFTGFAIYCLIVGVISIGGYIYMA